MKNSLNAEVYKMPKNALADLKEVLEGMPPSQVAAMRDEIHRWADAVEEDPSDFFASNWEVSKDWKKFKNGLFEPLFEACDEMGVADPVEYAGFMLEWLIRQEIVNRTDEWLFDENPEVCGHPKAVQQKIWGTFYRRMNRTNESREALRPVEYVSQ